MKTLSTLLTTVVLAALLPLSNASAEPTLWGIYGDHSMHDCPVINRETAKEVITISKTDLGP
jgi:hypothetical protein